MEKRFTGLSKMLVRKRVLVTGGAGFIGSAFIRYGLKQFPALEKIINYDLLTYAGNLQALSSVSQDSRYRFIQGDVRDEKKVEEICLEHKIDCIIHFAAESHVDRSIAGPRAFLENNVEGTFSLLEVVRRNPQIHFHQISTDEVYGSLTEVGKFSESSPYMPNSPYSASKAAADHFVRAYAETYNLSITLSHCSNNYGPYQHTEKFIPRMILNCLKKEPLPIYGRGINYRDWLFVEDHVEALWLILEKAKAKDVFDIGGGEELRNIDLAHLIVEELASMQGEDPKLYRDLITFVPDRLGHDFRYAIDASKMERTFGWKPRHTFKEALKKTIFWYINENCLHHSCTS
jgi:dTDP-glucose 4,6-dehydratase